MLPPLPAQTCLASNLSPGLAQPSSGVLFLAQPANCFVTLGKSPCHLTPSVSATINNLRWLQQQAVLEASLFFVAVTPCLWWAAQSCEDKPLLEHRE